jgi:hypothetical protein
MNADGALSGFVMACSLVGLLLYAIALALVWSSAHPLAKRARWPLGALFVLAVVAFVIMAVGVPLTRSGR